MTTSPPSSSEPPGSFARLHERVQHWIWEQRWDDLRPIQELSIPPILDGTRDVILAAATAAGKTEAAFLPICSRLVEREGDGIRALYIGPLKALINDQFARLELLCEHLQIPVHRWHGDVSLASKQRTAAHPQGILLITPESLEARFVLKGAELRTMLGPLEYIVIDELHSFIGTERGRHLQSLLHRLEVLLKRRIPRIGLSATLGDMKLAAQFIRPGDADAVALAVAKSAIAERKIQLRGYVESTAVTAAPRSAPRDPVDERPAMAEIAAHLFEVLRGRNHLVFANARRDVEDLADRLRRLSEERQVPNEFFPHHGSLSRELRERLEQRLKDGREPTTAVCTTTLELGIDIGSVESVAQVGVPPTVAGLQQRMGRSGRKPGKPSILRLYVVEEAPSARLDPQEALREQLVQTTAVVQLMLQKWYEPPRLGALHLSTLMHQVLAIIAQLGGARAVDLHQALCRSGPFAGVDPTTFAELLRGMGARQLLMQAADGTLLPGEVGEKLVNHYSFYSVFQTPEEYRIVCSGETLGTIPIEQQALVVDEFLVFAGRRWQIVGVEVGSRIVDVRPAPAGKVPRFAGSVGFVPDRVRAEMQALYRSDEIPIFLDERAKALLGEGRQAFQSFGLAQSATIPHERGTILITWRGDQVNNTIALMLMSRSIPATVHGMAIRCEKVDPASVRKELEDLGKGPPPDPLALAALIENKEREKFDPFLAESLLNREYASRYLDVAAAMETVARL